MRLAPFAGALAVAAVAAGCGGGAGGGSAPVAPIRTIGSPTPTPTASPVASGSPTATPTPSPTPSPTPTPPATLSISIVIPGSGSGTAFRRSPQYVSRGTQSIAVYDGRTLVYVGNVAPGTPPSITTVYVASGSTVVTGGSCSNGPPATCTVSITTSPGTHAFDLAAYNAAQSSSTLSGFILSEGELTVTLAPGPNPAQTLTPLGVASQAQFVPPTLTYRLNGNGPFVGIIGTSYTFQYAINDTSGNQIVQPGNYDNGPVTIAETDGGNIVTMTPVSQSSPPPATGNQTFTVTCANNGTATFTASARTSPTTAYASGITYNSSNYGGGTLGTTTLQCVPNSATQPVTVQ
jgi:hypothetical protein